MEILDSIFLNTKKIFLDLLGCWLPDWMILLVNIGIIIGVIAVLGPVIMMYLTLLERKIIGRMQNRIGPNRVGIFGILQPIADGIKMFTKEDIIPQNADKIVHFLAPVLMVIPALLAFAVLPFGRGMIPVNLNVGLLFFIAVSSTSTICVFMASWASRNKFSILGGMRSAAQMISYEIPMVLSVVPVILSAESLSTYAIVEAQARWSGLHWFVFTPWGLLAFIIFFLCGVAECNRSPFDLPEAESEIVAGFHTEYSGMKFALFYMAEYMNTFTVSALAATLFLGGWEGPVLPSWLWFFIKTHALIFVMFWFRGTLPRFRVDQLMGLAWKLFLPLTLINIFVAGGYHLISDRNFRVAGASAVLLVSFLLFTVFLNRKYMPEKRRYDLVD
ncbi:MAG: NADH-quinone oxidoreductase subunit NuoH [Candidatus Omnitrophica bacterium]|nr:NADH-quinone oxidoreductase subunit NuoH [Candidatus Omnitrophota bacterium]MDD5670280.1 NADH-quinone oxidoreductase subunit NuoH [Candidatus Omnitrophota bacterium]